MGHISRRVLTKCEKWPKMTKLNHRSLFLKCFKWLQHNINSWHLSLHLYLCCVRGFFLNIHIQSSYVPLKNLPFLRANFDFDPHGNMLKIKNLQFPSDTTQILCLSTCFRGSAYWSPISRYLNLGCGKTFRAIFSFWDIGI